MNCHLSCSFILRVFVALYFNCIRPILHGANLQLHRCSCRKTIHSRCSGKVPNVWNSGTSHVNTAWHLAISSSSEKWKNESFCRMSGAAAANSQARFAPCKRCFGQTAFFHSLFLAIKYSLKCLFPYAILEHSKVATQHEYEQCAWWIKPVDCY